MTTDSDRYRVVFEEAADGLLLLDDTGRIVEVNRAAATLLETTPAELAGRPFADFTPPDDRPDFAKAPPAHAVRERVLLTHRGARVSVEVTERRVHHGFLLVTRDLATRHAVQGQLALADRLASLGTLAAGIAHELNNPLSWMLSNLTHARDVVASAALPGGLTVELSELLSDSLEGVHRIASVVSDLRSFTRQDPPTGRVVVHRAIERACQLLVYQAQHRAELVRELGPVPDVRGSEAALTQVLVGILLNAVQALTESGGQTVTIRTSTSPRGAALISVTDSGPGIAPEVLPRVFDPFFTTRPVGIGTGLGLSVAWSIVTGMNGTIEAANQPGLGAVFRIALPPMTAPDLVNRANHHG